MQLGFKPIFVAIVCKRFVDMARPVSTIAKLCAFLGAGLAWSVLTAPAFLASPPQGRAGAEAGPYAGVSALRGFQSSDSRRSRSGSAGVPTAQLGLTALGVGLMALGALAGQARLAPPARRVVSLAALKGNKQDATTASQDTATCKAMQEVEEEVLRKQSKAAVDALTSHLERLDREENGTAATTKVEQHTGGNLAQYDDTWHIVREGETAPASATLSNCRLDASTSEYADADACLPCGGPQAWMSSSLISFDYRVAEVPRGKLLDPACDALIFGHLPFGSPERQAAEGRAQRRLVIIDETVDDLYGAKVRAYFEARGVVHEIMRLPMVEEEKSIENTLKVCKKMKEFNIDRRTEPVI